MIEYLEREQKLMKKNKQKDMYMGGGYARQMKREGGQADYSSIRDMALSCEKKTGGVNTKSKPTES